MNLELLFKMIKENYHRLRDEQEMLDFLKYQIKVYQLKKQKLKLGAIVFEIKEITLCDIVLYEEVDIRYIRQDNTDSDNLKIENRLKAIGWKWDTKNVVAFGVVIFIFLCEAYTHINYWYRKNLPTLAYRAEHFDYLLKSGFEWSLTPITVGDLKARFASNYWLVELFTDYCIYFNVIF